MSKPERYVKAQHHNQNKTSLGPQGVDFYRDFLHIFVCSQSGRMFNVLIWNNFVLIPLLSRGILDAPATFGAGIFEAPTHFGAECSGGLVFEKSDGTRDIVTQSVYRTSIRFQTVSMAGCGCFRLHSGGYGRGSTIVVTSATRKLTRAEVGFPRVRSIFRIQCPFYFWQEWA